MGPYRTPRKNNPFFSPYPTPRTPFRIAKTLFAGAAKQAASAAGKALYNKFSGGTRSQIATTTHHDVARQYRYKRMPRAKRRRWVRKIRQNDALDMHGSSTQTLALNNSLTGTLDYLANGKSQNWVAVHLYGLNGDTTGVTQEIGIEDMKYLKTTDLRLKGQSNSRVKFESAIMDLTIKNPNVNNGLEVDIYEVMYRTTSKQTSMTNLHADIFNTTVSNRSPSSPNDIAAWDRRGITPFDTVQFGALGAKILSKKKAFLPPGATVTHQYRDAKNHYFGPDTFDDTTGYIKPYVTRTILLVYKTIAGEAISGSNPTIVLGVTRIYKYKIKGEVESGILLG